MDRKNAVILGAAGAATVAALAFVATTGASPPPPPTPCPALPPSSFLCICLRSSGVTPNLPTGQTSNGSVVITYVQSIGGTCAQDGYYLYLSGEDAAGIGTTCGYWLITAGGSGSLTLSVSPTSVPPGGTLSFTGTGFTPFGRVDINAVGQNFWQIYPVILADSSGRISSSVVIPSNALSGVASLKAGDEGTNKVVSAPFVVV